MALRTSHVTVGGRTVEVETALVGGDVEARIDGRELRAAVAREGTAWRVTVGERSLHLTVVRDRALVWVAVDGEIHRCTVAEAARSEGAATHVHSPEVAAPMPGKVIEVAVRPGQEVAVGDPLVVLEAMKMETVLTAEAAARVLQVHVAAGAMVEPGQTLVTLAFA
jgi:3-methylcrotonyl-CoA carboxylase alpha subunit